MPSSELPAPGAQALPRAVRLPGLDAPAPAAQLPLLAGADGRLELEWRGHAFPRALPDGATFTVLLGAPPRAGGLALVNAGGVADVRRLLAPAPDGWATGLDARPGARETLPARALMGLLDAPARGPLARAVAGRLDAWRAEWIRAGAAVALARGSDAGLTGKFADQASGYAALAPGDPPPAILGMVRAAAPEGGAVLVAGCGAGQELRAIARAGFRVTGVDLVPEMTAAAGATLAAAGLPGETLTADLRTFAAPGRRWDLVFCTPLVLSFILDEPGRIATLRALGAHLAPGGALLCDAREARDSRHRLRLALARLRARTAGVALARGSACTWRLAPDGTLAATLVHYGSAESLRREAAAAGFTRFDRLPTGWWRFSGFDPAAR